MPTGTGDRQSPAPLGGAGRGAPYALPRSGRRVVPGISRGADRLRGLPELRGSQVSGLGLGRAPDREWAGLRTTARRCPTPSSWPASGGSVSTGWSWSRPCSAWRCSSRCCWTRAAAGRGVLPARDLPAVRRTGGHRVPAVGLPVPAGCQPVRVPAEQDRRDRTRCALLRWHPVRGGEHRHLGWHRLQHDRALHLSARPSRATCTRPPRSTARRRCRSPARQDPDGEALADHDVPVLDHRDPAGVRRTDDAEAADEHHLEHLDAADEDLPRRLRPQRHLFRCRHVRDHRAGDHCAVLRLPQLVGRSASTRSPDDDHH